MKIEDLKQRMIDVTDKYSKMSLEDLNLQSVSRCLKITEHALKILRTLEPVALTPIELALENFCLTIVEPVSRTQAYGAFVSWCQKNELIAIPYASFCQEMEDRGFTSARRKSAVFLIPPEDSQNCHRIDPHSLIEDQGM